MKYFKLIKEYPGSYKLGYLTDGIPEPCSVYTFFPNFWEEVIEKEYEILSFYAKNIAGKGDNYIDPDFIWKKQSKNKWARWSEKRFCTVPYTLEQISNHNNYGIHSIKRLSDNEIFTIGDKVSYSEIHKYDFKIASFHIIKGNNIELRGTGDAFTELTDRVVHVKQSLFVTEDNVEIFEGDGFYFVKNKNSKSIDTMWEVSESLDINKQGFKYEPQFEVYYKSREKAKEYILMNKPCLSMADILMISAPCKNTNRMPSPVRKQYSLTNLKQIINKKLNNN